MIAETILINNQDLNPQEYSPQDVNLISTFNIPTFLSSSSNIESFIYDLNKTLIQTNYNFTNYKVQNDGQFPSTEQLSQIIISPEDVLLSNGFTQGSYITYFNFFNNHIGSYIEPLYIIEISDDRTEIRLDSNVLSNIDIKEKTDNFIQYRNESEYFVDFYLNFGNNNLFIANNIILDEQDPQNNTILIKLYEPLPQEFNINSTTWVVTSFEESLAYQTTFQDEPIIIKDTLNIKGPNFNLNVKDQVNNSTLELSYLDLITTQLTSSTNQLNSLLEEKEIDINIDYNDYSNFIHFSSAQTRLENFYYKISLIEQYSSSISLINTQITGSTSSSLSVSGSVAFYESKIDNIITNFDGYDYFLYYSSGSKAWPKTTSTPPYSLALTGSNEVLTWFGSTLEYSPLYGGMMLSSSEYDSSNKDNLLFSIPEYLREDEMNQPYELFIDMVAQHFDNIWIYYKDVTNKYTADNRLDVGISKDIVADAIRDFGVKLYQNNFSNNDLFTAFLGLTPDGALFPFPNITSSLPTPSGYEYINTFISASNDYIPLDDVNKSLYKRIYHNLPYLLKSKGTIPGLRALITSYGIPDTILRINEFGGKDKINLNDWDYWQEEFNYSYHSSGDNYISIPFTTNPSWVSQDNHPSNIEFRFKTDDISNNIPYSQSLISSNGKINLTLTYTGSGTISGSYSGSIPDPYNEYATLTLYPVSSSITQTCSVYLPFFNGDWWSVMINKTKTQGTTGSFSLHVANKIYEGGNNGTQIGFNQSSSIVDIPLATFLSTSTLDFGKSSNINGTSYTSFSGSFQEIRYFKKPIDQDVFENYVMNPYSIEGNNLNTSPDELIFRLPLGGELYTSSISIHPKVTGSWIATSSFASSNSCSFQNTPVFLPNTEYFYYDQPNIGIQNPISDKIRLEDNILPTGDTLSAFKYISQQSEVSSSYTANTNLLEVAFSPQDEINDDISSQIGYFDIGEYIGDPLFRTSRLTSYPDLDNLRNEYFEKYTKNYNLNDFIRLIKFFDNSLFKMIKDFIPARTSLASGIVIKQHFLERNRYPEPIVSSQEDLIEGIIHPQWDDYEPNNIENFSGGDGGSFIFDISQSWEEYIQSPLGPLTILNSTQDEFFNGEFSGSQIQVSQQILQTPYPLNLTPIIYNSSGSTSTIPSPGSFTWQTDFNKYNQCLYVSSLYINELDINGLNIQTALSNLSSGDNIIFTITGSIESFPILPPTPVPYNKTFLGVITSINPSTTGVWNIQLSSNINELAVIDIVDPLSYINYPSNLSNSNLFLSPFINDISNYYNSDFNPLINNAVDIRKNTIYSDVDYSQGSLIPVNFLELINGGSIKSNVQDSNYTTKRHIIPRYLGSKSTSSKLNKWTYTDTGTYGKLPNIELNKVFVAYSETIGGYAPELMNASGIIIKYLIDQEGNIIIPNTSENSLSDTQGTFITGENISISSNALNSGVSNQRTIIRGGQKVEPILYNQIGHTPPTWESSITLTDNNQIGGVVSNFQSTLTPSSNYNSGGNVWTTLKTNNIQSSGSSSTLPLVSTSYRYEITSDMISEGIDLTMDVYIDILNPIQLTSTAYARVSKYDGVSITPVGNSIGVNNNNGFIAPFSSGNIQFSIGVPNSELVIGDQYFLEILTGISSIQYLSSSTFQINQFPIPTSPIPTTGLWNVFGSTPPLNQWIYTTSPDLITYYNNPTVYQENISGSGFNPITIPWSLKKGDEFRFEGREDRVWMVNEAAISDYFGSPRLFVILDKPVTGSVDLDQFLIRRYVDNPGSIIFQGSKPSNDNGPYIVKPEYVSPSLNKNIDTFITDLTQKGLL